MFGLTTNYAFTPPPPKWGLRGSKCAGIQCKSQKMLQKYNGTYMWLAIGSVYPIGSESN